MKPMKPKPNLTPGFGRKPIVVPPIKLDLGCGGKKKGPDWTGCDQYKMEGVDKVFNIGKDRWPFKDESVGEANATHFLEHLTNFEGRWERVHFFNELWRVLKVGATASIILPHWCSNRYYGDPTHKEPWSEMGFYYLSDEWRLKEAPHTDIKWNPNGYRCNFQATWGYALHPSLVPRNQEYQQHAMQFWKEAAQDVISTLTKRPLGEVIQKA